MIKAIKVRIYLNRYQEELAQKNFDCVRFVFNYMLDLKSKLYKRTGENLSYNEACAILTKIKKRKPWLKEADSTALQQVIKDLFDSYSRFFNGSGYPKFKSSRDKQSYRTRVYDLNVENSTIKILKVGIVRFRDKYKFESLIRIRNVTISKSKSGKYFASICIEVEPTTLAKAKKSCGIDFGLKDLCILSDGTKFENPRFRISQYAKRRLRALHKALSRKEKGSKGWERARIRLAREYERLANMHLDYLHKLTTWIVRNYDFISVETLKVKNMLKNHKLARAIADAGWYELARQLKYKTKWYDKQFVKISTYYASSQICSNCGDRNPAVKKLSVREWECPNCHMYHDRDLNAAMNILNEGLKQI